MKRIYACIDLKSFYASVECVERGLDPLNTNLVVADKSRTEKTICLAVTPSLKQYGLSGRARLYEVEQKVKEINFERKKLNSYHKFTNRSYLDSELQKNKSLELTYIIAPPRMKKYMDYSAKIYNIYLKYLAPEDIFVYSIDEVFIEVTAYLKYYKMSASELVSKIIKDIYKTTGITATAGIGTNLYLAKVCMDIVAKKSPPNEIGVRIAEIDEKSYRELLWHHQPLTDFWRVGKGYTKKLAEQNIFTMGDVARCSIHNEDLLYKLFGVNAELLINHAWGYEPVTLSEVKNYKPEKKSLSSGQVLHFAYNYQKVKLIVKEMIELLSLDLVEKHLVTNQLVLTIRYDRENLTNKEISKNYIGTVTIDSYGRKIPKHGHGTINLDYYSSSTKYLSKKCLELFERIINKKLLVRKVTISARNLITEEEREKNIILDQLDLFTNACQKELEIEKQKEELKLQHAILDIKNKYGKSSILKGMNLEEGATTIERNNQIGGHQG
ncbi:MAG: DNA methylase [Bacilli bacterium]|nr:DNA methylase [Bacilli bacterium]